MATKNVRIFGIFLNPRKITPLSNRYKAGMLNTDVPDNENDREMSRLINETTTSILRIFNTYGAQAVEDWEVNELLEWTDNLNYDDYLLDWRTIGTSASSNIILGKLFLEIFLPYYVPCSSLDNGAQYQQFRDIDDRTNSTLTESRHVSVQANVPTVGSIRILPTGDDEPSFERTTTTALSQPASEHNK